MARIYTSFTKSKEAQKALRLIAGMGYLVVQAHRIDHDTVGSNGEWLLCIDTDQQYVSCMERVVYRNSEWIMDTDELIHIAMQQNAVNNLLNDWR